MIDPRALVMAQSGENINTILDKADRLHKLNRKDPIQDIYDKYEEKHPEKKTKYYIWTDPEEDFNDYGIFL